MFIEIDGRQTGKTTRLITAANEAINDGYDVGVVSPTARYMDTLNHNAYRAVSFESLERIMQRARVPMFGSHTRLFFDEFEWLRGSLPIVATAYYTTSPNRVRVVEFIKGSACVDGVPIAETDDFLVQLLEANGWAYQTSARVPFTQNWGYHAANVGSERAKTEIQGQFMELKGIMQTC